jgi:aminoglycoside/choline kinase family phosphotransferase
MNETHDIATLRSLYRDHFRADAEDVRALRGDGSDRRIYRMTGNARTCIGIVSSNAGENRAFISFSRSFRELGLPVPDIYTTGPGNGSYLEQDLGDVTLYAWVKDRQGEGCDPNTIQVMYERVLQDLQRFQIDAAEHIDYQRCYPYQEFGPDAMRFDIAYFKEMFLDQFFDGEYDAPGFHGDAEKLMSFCLEADRGFFLYRDFQSRNIMILNGDPHFIDYQSGRRGALHYDPASLLYDARARLPQPMRDRLRDVYITLLSRRMTVHRDSFIATYDAYAILRVMQALGAFGNLGIRKNKPSFLEGIPPGLGNLRHLAETAEILQRLPALRKVFLAISLPSAVTRFTALIGENT